MSSIDKEIKEGELVGGEAVLSTKKPGEEGFEFNGMSRRGGCSQRLTLVSGPVTCQFPHGVLFRSR